MSDVGFATTEKFIAQLKKNRFEQDITLDEVKESLASTLEEILQPMEQSLNISEKPTTILMVGVNGSGKTTTAGKLAAQWKSDGLKVRLAAADTFRAAAIDQLKIWAERANVPIETAPFQSDAASLAFQSFQTATDAQDDVLCIDTAGRLHTKKHLMESLQKIPRVLGKINDNAPHYTLLVLDGNIGQNSIQQVKEFRECIPIHGLIVTKLDGTAKAGIVIQLGETFNLPIYYIGVGEGIDDLITFNARWFVRNLLGLSDH